MKTAILTGPAGVLGTALRKKLAQEHVQTYVVCHPGSRRTAEIEENEYIHKVECDMRDYAHLPERIGEPCDVFFHLAWLGTADHLNRLDVRIQEENIRYTLDAVDAAHALGCSVFVGAGSQAEYGHVDGVLHPDTPAFPVSGYGMGKLCAGQMTRLLCHSYGMRHVWTRTLSTYGLGDGKATLINTLIEKLLAGEKPSLTAGGQVWDYIYADDAAGAFYAAAERGRDGAVYVIGSGTTKRLREYMEITRDAIDPSLPLGIGEIPYYPDQAMHLEADVAPLKRDTGWEPKVRFEDGIRRLIAEKRAQMQGHT